MHTDKSCHKTRKLLNRAEFGQCRGYPEKSIMALQIVPIDLLSCHYKPLNNKSYHFRRIYIVFTISRSKMI